MGGSIVTHQTNHGGGPEHWAPVAPHHLAEALDYVRGGGRLVVATAYQRTVITPKVLASWERDGDWLLKEEGEGFRLRRGRKSEFVLAGYLRYLA